MCWIKERKMCWIKEKGTGCVWSILCSPLLLACRAQVTLLALTTPVRWTSWPCLPSKRRNYSEIELLFQLLRAFTGRFLCNMTFLKEYMEEEIPRNYSIVQKRALFFRFVEFNDPHFNDELKAKVCHHAESWNFLCASDISLNRPSELTLSWWMSTPLSVLLFLTKFPIKVWHLVIEMPDFIVSLSSVLALALSLVNIINHGL